MNWYAIYTTPRAEKKTAERLSKSTTVEVFLPQINEKRVWSDRIKIVARPLFSSYVFVRTKDCHLRDFLSVEGVVRVIYYDKKPAILSDKEIAQIRRFVELTENGIVEVGDTVEILTGGLKSVSGKVQRIGKTHLYIYLEQLGASVCVRQENSKKVSKQ